MKNLSVSCPKIIMHLFFLLLIFHSCTDEDSATIMLNTPENNAPIAVTTADILSGDAPLQINFTGNNSSDDSAIVSYYWEFPGDTSSAQNATYTFNNPGVYDIRLTVTDDESLRATATLTIIVTEGSEDNIGVEDNIIGACTTNGGKANESGLKTWCWNDITLPTYSGTKGVSFSDDQLFIDSECNENALSIVDNQLHFFVDPNNPPVDTSWCERDFNMRAEIRTNSWNVKHPIGTEEWFGWSYAFGNNYIIDQNNEWLFFQVHPAIVGESPHMELLVNNDSQFSGHDAGEIYVVNKGNYPDNHPTGITPVAGETLDIVVHAVWGDESNGLLQVWINGQSVYDKQVRTIYAAYPWGGNAKWGIYKWPWADEAGVLASAAQGITSLETYMGPLRIITRKPGDIDYLTDSYSLVAPD